MVKKKAARKPSGAASIGIIDEVQEINDDAGQDETNGDVSDEVAHAESNGSDRPKRQKAKTESQANGSVGVGEIRKAAAFANSVGGLDKAISLLQILKVAKEVQ
jgi:hypothetical protein